MQEFISPNEEQYFGETDSITIQNAISAAERSGCRKIVIPRYNARRDACQWRISVSIKVPDNFIIVLDNCYMVMETGVYDHMFTNSLAYDEKSRNIEGEQKNITIVGEGNVILDGGVHNRLLEKTALKYGLPAIWKNTMFHWVNVNGLRVENLHIENQRWWAMTHVFCRNVKIKNIDFFAIPHVRNMDGIDLRVGCNNFEIENITGRTGDDVIALTALLGRGERMRLVDGKDTDIHDVKIRNVKGDPDRWYVVRLLNHDGNRIYNIDMDTVMDSSDFTTKCRSAGAITVGSPLYYSIRPALPGETSNIAAKNITSRSLTAISFNYTCCDSVFSNIKTFGDNINGIGTGSTTTNNCCDIRRVTVEHFWYGAQQQEIFCSKDLTPDRFIGNAFNFINTQGEIKLRDIHIDKVQTVFRASGGISMDIKGYKCILANQECVIDNKSTLTVDGEVRA